MLKHLQSTPQYRRLWDWRKTGGIGKTAVLENGGKGSLIYYITKKKHIRDLKISSKVFGGSTV